MEDDHLVRTAAFQWLREQSEIHGDRLPRKLLAEGFPYRGRRVYLLGASGIFKPKIMDLPLSITTAPSGPYDDHFSAGVAEADCIMYQYRKQGGPGHRDNEGLREALKRRAPLIYFFGLSRGYYLPCWPAYIVGDDRGRRCFKIAFGMQSLFTEARPHGDRVAEAGERSYATSIVKARLHQRSFRERVLAAYRRQCAFCRLRFEALLDASHIVPDSEAHGKATVNNGLALCKLHHAAFDKFMLGVAPDFRIHVRADILDEKDGPMLQHGLKELHQTKIILPRTESERPDPAALEWRFERFVSSGP